MMNQRKSVNPKTSQYKGVCQEKDKALHKKKWSAFIYLPKRKRLGYFATEEEAARAYDEAAKIHFGEYARLNFPP